MTNNIWVDEIRLKSGGQTLQVAFTGAVTHSLSATLLRVESPSAEVQGHSPDQKIIVTGKDDVKITDVQPVGNYAVRLIFDDGHHTGIYTWDHLYKLGTRLADS